MCTTAVHPCVLLPYTHVYYYRTSMCTTAIYPCVLLLYTRVLLLYIHVYYYRTPMCTTVHPCILLPYTHVYYYRTPMCAAVLHPCALQSHTYSVPYTLNHHGGTTYPYPRYHQEPAHILPLPYPTHVDPLLATRLAPGCQYISFNSSSTTLAATSDSLKVCAWGGDSLKACVWGG